jgi:hypothetical protein
MSDRKSPAVHHARIPSGKKTTMEGYHQGRIPATKD